MADHINISAPRKRFDLDDELRQAKLEAEMKVLQLRYDTMANDLDAIFTRIARGGDETGARLSERRLLRELETEAKSQLAAIDVCRSTS